MPCPIDNPPKSGYDDSWEVDDEPEIDSLDVPDVERLPDV